MKVVIYSALSNMMQQSRPCFVLCLNRFCGDVLKVRLGQVHVKRMEKSFTATFQHSCQSLLLTSRRSSHQKPSSKAISGFDLWSLTSRAAVNPRQQEVIARLRSPKSPLGSTLPFPQPLQRQGCPSTVSSSLQLMN